jgi:hypothetical protein
MVTIDMSLMPLKIIGKKTRLQTKGPFGLLKDLGPKRCQKFWRKEESKEIMDFVKVEDGSMHCKKYDGRCTK